MARKVVHKVNRLELPESQQKAAEALFIRRSQVLSEANKELAEIGKATAELAEMFAQQQKMAGDWEFAQDGPRGSLYLKRKEEKEPKDEE